MNILNKIFFKIRYIRSLADLGNVFITIFFSHILRKRSEWNIAYTRINWKNGINKNKVNKISNPKNHWFADPHVIKEKKFHYIFFEDYSLKKGKGSISCIRVDKNNRIKHFREIIEENFHLSFPFIFKYNKNYFMIPESEKDNSIRLYKCVTFPNKWKFVKKIIENINCVDSVLFKWKKKWILLTSQAGNKFLHNKLFAFTAKNPISNNWTKLNSSPIVYSNISGRNAGLIIESRKKIYRISQAYLPGNYGAFISINKILNIFKNKYHEKKIKDILPLYEKNIRGIHTLNYVKNFTVFDYSKWVK